MKLDDQQMDAVLQQVGAEPIPEDNPIVEQLNGAFGEHTYYVGQEGLFVFEAVDRPAAQGDQIVAVHIAEWADADKTELGTVEPRVTEVVVTPGSDGTDDSR